MADLERFVAFSLLNENIAKNLLKIKSEYMMHTFGLRSGDAICLVEIKNHAEGISSVELARACGVDRSVISRMVPELIARGIIRYKDAVEGKRSYRTPLVLTEEGLRITEEMRLFTQNGVRNISGDIPSDELAGFYRVFRKLDRRIADLAGQLEKQSKEQEQP